MFTGVGVIEGQTRCCTGSHLGGQESLVAVRRRTVRIGIVVV